MPFEFNAAHLTAEEFIRACRSAELDLQRRFEAAALTPFDMPAVELLHEERERLTRMFWKVQAGTSYFGGLNTPEQRHVDSAYTEEFSTRSREDGRLEVIIATRRHQLEMVREAYLLEHDGSRWWIVSFFNLGRPRGPQPSTPRLPSTPAPGTTFHTPLRPMALGTHFQFLRDLQKLAYRLHPRLDPSVDAHCSHMGGPFWNNAPATWPRCEEHDTFMVGLLQVYARDLPIEQPPPAGDFFAGVPFAPSPRLRPRSMFPADRDLLQIFWCPFDIYNEANYQVRWLDSKGRCEVQRLTNPLIRQPKSNERIAKPHRLYPEVYVDYPDARDVALHPSWSDLFTHPEFLELMHSAFIPDQDYLSHDKLVGAYYYENYAAAPGLKLGGYPRWIQDPETPRCECGREMVLLFALDYDSCNDPIWGTLEEQGDASRQPSVVDIWGVGHFFMCLECEGRPTKYVY